jgi:hypothetical protein
VKLFKGNEIMKYDIALIGAGPAGCGRRGGYNLQKAFSTGYVAGNSASEN